MDRAFQHMKVEEPAEGVAVVSFNRPSRRNAPSDAMIDEMLAINDALVDGYPDRYRAVVIRGEGAGFSAGGDLEAFHAMLGKPRNVIQTYIARIHQWSQSLHALPMPTIAAIHGKAVGGGAAMGMACDICYASDDAELSFSFIHIGLIPDMGSHFTLPARIGVGRAMDVLLSGEPIDAQEAYRLGLVTRLFPTREALDDGAVAKAAAIARAPAVSARRIKELVWRAAGSSMGQTIADEVEFQTARFAEPAFARRLETFLAKRSA